MYALGGGFVTGWWWVSVIALSAIAVIMPIRFKRDQHQKFFGARVPSDKVPISVVFLERLAADLEDLSIGDETGRIFQMSDNVRKMLRRARS